MGGHGGPRATTEIHTGGRQSENATRTQCQASPSKKAKKQSAAELASHEVEAAAEDGWRLVYVDSSSKPLWKGSKHRAGGIGIHSQEDSQSRAGSISEPLPPGFRQMNNAAELRGAIRVLNRLLGDKLAILSNSEYLPSGARGQVHL